MKPVLIDIIFLLFSVVSAAAITRSPQPPLLYEEYGGMPLDELYDRGAELFRIQKNDSAVMLLTLAVQRDTTRLTAEERRLMAKARNVLGLINFNHANYQAAYTHFLKSIQLDGRPDAGGYLSLASVFLHFGDKTRAFRYIKDYTQYAIRHRHFNEACIGISNMLTTDFAKEGTPNDSIERVVVDFLNLPDDVGKSRSYSLAYPLAKGWMENRVGRHIEAAGEIRSALSELDTTLMDRSKHALYLVIADQYKKAGVADSAFAYLSKAERMAAANGHRDLLAKTYSDASLTYAEFGDSGRSERYRYRMLELNDSLFNPKELGKLHDLNMFYEVDKFERRIELMNLREHMRLIVLWTVGIALLVVVVLLGLLYRQNRSLKRKNRLLFERNLSEMKAEKAASTDAGGEGTHVPVGKDISGVEESADIDRMDASIPDNPDEHPGVGDTSVGENEEGDRKYVESNLSDQTRATVLRRIKEVFADETTFCQEGFSLNDLSRICESNTRYVSQIINEDMQTTFTQLLNNERVKVARKRLLDIENYGNQTIESIIGSLGCKSRSTFSKTFKRITGLSPSEFQRMARSQAEDAR